MMRRLPPVKRQALSSSDLATESTQAHVPNAHLASAPAGDQPQQPGLTSLTGVPQQQRHHNFQVSDSADPAAAHATGASLQPAGRQANAQQLGGPSIEGATDLAAEPPGPGRVSSNGLQNEHQEIPGQVQANAAALLATSKPAFLPEEDDYDADE